MPARKRRLLPAELEVFGPQRREEERPARTLVVHPARRDGVATRSEQARLDEAVGLARAIRLDVVDAVEAPLRRIRPSTLFGEGKLDELKAVVDGHDIELVVINGALTPVQQRNLEKALKAKVIDRTSLILEIFGERAQTAEGRMQVELAALGYQRSRLVRSWTHLERQRGGYGFMGGPGEAQIELDRRRIDERITRLKADLESVTRTRGLHREARRRVPFPVIALVGYTNAGKSTLFNSLTGAAVVARDQLFATLDPTMRLLALPGGGKAVLSDTVGFVADLPTGLVAAFRATLEEVRTADVILHVRDIAHHDSEAQREDVLAVLAELDLDEVARSERVIEFWNKADLLDPEALERCRAEAARRDDVLVGSAKTGDGLDRLAAALAARITRTHDVVEIELAPADGEGLAWLYRHGTVLERDDGEHRTRLRVALAEGARARLEHQFPAAAIISELP